jgi:anti-sigma factor RsiW
MNKTHLTPGQLDALLIGDRDDAATRHLEACPACAAELSDMRASISLLSSTVTNIAQVVRFRHNTHSSMLSSPVASRRRPIFHLTATLALAASVAIIAAVVPVGRLIHPPTAQAPIAAPARTLESDEALLTEIDQQLSASVPEALAPLEDPTSSQPKTATSTNKKD